MVLLKLSKVEESLGAKIKMADRGLSKQIDWLIHEKAARISREDKMIPGFLIGLEKY